MFRCLPLAVLVLLWGSFDLGAQSIAQKLDPSLKILIHPGPQNLNRDALTKQAGRPVVQVLIKGQPAAVRSVVLSVGGHVGAVVGDILSARIPPDAIREVAGHPSVERMEHVAPKTRYNDRAAAHVGATQVHGGASPLPQGYTGKEVVVGIIDSGIDFRHRDFRDPQDPNKTRILAIWDHSDETGPAPEGFDYGTLWTKEQIESALRGEGSVGHADTEGHGTHVAGSAVGNGAASDAFKGIAPEAHVIIVKDQGTGAVDGSSFIFAEAAKLGLPAVVNYSAGGHAGAHDGSSMEEQALDRLVSEAPGRVFVTAAGNEGGDFIHWGGFEIGTDSLWTYYHANVYGELSEDGEGGAIASMAIFGTVFNPVAGQTFLALGVDTTRYADFFVQPLGFHGSTPWRSLDDLTGQEGAVRDTLFYTGGQPAGAVEFSAQSLENGNVNFALFIEDFISAVDTESPESAVGADLWRVLVKGQGVVHAWSEKVLTAEHRDVQLSVDDAFYRPTDNRYTVGMPATANRVITVGAYTNVEVEGESAREGALAGFSSKGPTTDGRIKPEIVAPGENVTSALSSGYSGADQATITPDGQHYRDSGTSFASPVTAGALALYFQKNPTASNEAIRELMSRTAKTDAFTSESGALPNAFWGHGKLDIFAMLTDGIPTSSAPSPDFTGDGEVNFQDFLLFAQGFGTGKGDEKFDARLDLNEDDQVGFQDFLIFAQAFGKPAP